MLSTDCNKLTPNRQNILTTHAARAGAAVVANIYKKKNAQPFGVKDFLLKFKPQRKKKWQELLAIVELINQSWVELILGQRNKQGGEIVPELLKIWAVCRRIWPEFKRGDLRQPVSLPPSIRAPVGNQDKNSTCVWLANNS